MQLPADLREWIAGHAEALPFADLKRACTMLSETYRSGAPTASAKLPPAFRTAAYLATRFPATYAAAHAALREVETPVESMLDLGAGAGAATQAARMRFESLRSFTLVEPDPAFSDAGRQMLPDAQWIASGIHAIGGVSADLVTVCYTLGELSPDTAIDAAVDAWSRCTKVLAIIEPGTTRGFTLIRRIRAELIARGAHLLAPCPGTGPCPIAGGDWCHFAARVERSALHRRLKGGELSYEDEKFSYLVFTRDPCNRAPARIVRHPRHHPGLIELTVCTQNAISHEHVFKRTRLRFAAARKAGWGDSWGLDS